MSRTMLLYKKIAPVNKSRHANWGVTGSDRYDFASETNSVPLTALEFPNACQEYPILFSQSSDGTVMPIVMLGIANAQNLFVGSDGYWKANYIPAYVRRYPFIFSTANEGETLTLCVDEEFEGVSDQGEGERLFTEEGENTPYLEKVVAFLKEYQGHFQRSQIFCKKLVELELLESMTASFKSPDGQERTLNGFLAVSREKLKKIPADKLAELVQTDEMELIYAHLTSLQNIKNVIQKAAAQ